jgi:lyso-ornithine lipid O-acyltransferase
MALGSLRESPALGNQIGIVGTKGPFWHPFSEGFDAQRRAWAAMAGIFGTILLCIPPSYFAKLFKPGGQPYFPRRFHRVMCWALRIKVDEVGQPASGPSVLFVANHWSWVDIPVIGSRLLATFVAKAEVGQMGLLGRMADLQQTIYVDREKRTKAADQRNEIAERLLQGHNVILFPEGTSGSGATVLPFKTTLFGVTDALAHTDVLIQPVTISYTHVNGMPVNRANRYKIAWVGDMDFGPHAWGLLGLGRIRAVIQYHPAVRRDDFASRKDLARHCETMVAQGLRAARAGRLQINQSAAPR